MSLPKLLKSARMMSPSWQALVARDAKLARAACRRGFERLLRKLLRMKHQPALLVLHWCDHAVLVGHSVIDGAATGLLVVQSAVVHRPVAPCMMSPCPLAFLLRTDCACHFRTAHDLKL